MISPDFVFSGAVLLCVGPIAFFDALARPSDISSIRVSLNFGAHVHPELVYTSSGFLLLGNSALSSAKGFQGCW